MQRRLIPSLLVTLLASFLPAAHAGAATPVQAAREYEQIQLVRKDAAALVERDPSPQSLQKAASELEKLLAMLAEPEVHARGAGHAALYFQGFNVRPQLAAVYLAQGDKEKALKTLEGMLQYGQAASIADWIGNDKALAPLRGEPRFQALLDANRAATRMWDTQVLASPYKPVLSNEEKVAGLSLFWSEARHGFAHFDHVPQLDWNKTYMEYLGKVLAAPTTADYYKVMMQLAPLLQDGHTNIYAPDELENRFYARPPLRTALVQDKVLVVEVNSPSLRKRVQAGDEVLAVDGLPVREYAEKRVAPYVSSSTPQDRQERMYSSMLLNGDSATPLTLRLRSGAGAERIETVARDGYADIEKRQHAEFRLLPGNVAYLRIDTFGDDSGVKALEAALPQLMQASALVIDVRRNGGGNSNHGYDVLSYLDSKPLATSWSYVRDDNALERARGNSLIHWRPVEGSHLYERRREHVFAGPVAVLIGPYSFSAAEDFSVAYEAMGRGPLVGSATGGSTGQPMRFPLPGGGLARICVKRDVRPDGRTFVGKGIEPTIPVEATVADVRAGRDAVLERALEALRTKAGLR